MDTFPLGALEVDVYIVRVLQLLLIRTPPPPEAPFIVTFAVSYCSDEIKVHASQSRLELGLGYSSNGKRILIDSDSFCPDLKQKL